MVQNVEGLIERIAALRPLLDKNAARTEAERRVVEENIIALKAAGAFRIMVPQRYGGYQTSIRTKLEVSREVAKGCGSTAWVTALMNVCAFFVGLMNEKAQNDVWGKNPDARIEDTWFTSGRRSAFCARRTALRPSPRRARCSAWGETARSPAATPSFFPRRAS